MEPIFQDMPPIRDMSAIVQNSEIIYDNMVKLVDVLYLFCHNNFMPENGEKNGRLKKYPFFPQLMTAIGALILDNTYDPPIFVADEKLRDKFYWLYTNCDWIVKRRQTPYFYRCLAYKELPRVKSEPFNPSAEVVKESSIPLPFGSEKNPTIEELEEQLAILSEKLASLQRSEPCLNQQP